MRQLVIAGLASVLSVLLMGRELPAGGEPRAAGSPAPTPVATILAAPEQYQGQEVVIRGRVQSANREVFPNGRPSYTLSVGDEGATLTVFSWRRPAAREGDLVEVAGVFRLWRYNLRHMIESARITRLERVR